MQTQKIQISRTESYSSSHFRVKKQAEFVLEIIAWNKKDIMKLIIAIK